MGTVNTLKVGAIYHGCSDNKGQRWPQQPYLVLREATYDEWEACARENDVPITPEVKALAQSGRAKFYGISTD
jgi:hypothetical protein